MLRRTLWNGAWISIDFNDFGSLAPYTNVTQIGTPIPIKQ